MLAAGALLGQLRPADTNTASLFVATLGTEITSIAVCNNTAGAVTFRLHHDEGGETYDIGNALYYDKSVPANDTVWVRAESMGAGIQMQEGDGLGVRSSSANALTFTAYGQTERRAERTRQ